jgi:chromosome partitioning protein
VSSARIVVFANEKGGTGKSTTAMHAAVALIRDGRRVVCVDIDSHQSSLGHYVRNRRAFGEAKGITLPSPDLELFEFSGEVDRNVAEAADRAVFDDLLSRLCDSHDYVVVDCPGNDTPLTRYVIGFADTLVTPINDSFVDLDLLGEIGGSPPQVVGPSVFSQAVWEQRQARAQRGAGPIDWIVLRNRLSPLDSRNKKNVGITLVELAERIGFRLIDGFFERVIFRQLFLQGLTVLDLKDDGSDPTLNLSHVAARQEIRRLVEEIDGRPRTHKPAPRADDPVAAPIPQAAQAGPEPH